MNLAETLPLHVQTPLVESRAWSVGGGGLLCGVIQGLHRHGWTDLPVVAVETIGADSLAQSLAAGECVKLARITSVATTLDGVQVCEQAFSYAQLHPVTSLMA